MVRRPRRRSESGLYHVILRGINKQVIFGSDDERFQLLYTMNRFVDTKKFILLFDTQKQLETFQSCLN